MVKEVCKIVNSLKKRLDKELVSENPSIRNLTVELECILDRYIDLLKDYRSDLDLKETKPFNSIEDAKVHFRGVVWGVASSFCGVLCFGRDEFVFSFILGSKEYLGSYQVEYKCHDKRYYYVDEVHGFKYWEKPSE